MSTRIGSPRIRSTDQVEQLERGRISPMHVLEDNQHRLLPRQTLELVEKGGERLSPLLRWSSEPSGG